MGQALYRKYRSKSLDEIVGQEHITQTLGNALKQGVTSHAYLFTGPRGVGKTSIARILAYQINGLPYDESATHLDIIEIDAASNRRIDEIRDLRDRARISPTSAKYKVYIIDEVHMLTKEAFNALLKTLEEPPAHVIFVLATTEVHKLPDTIISRTQRFTFKPIGQSDVVSHLRHIADREDIDITDSALELIAVHGGGSFRDSISLLDQARGIGKIDEAEIRRMLGIAPDEAVEQLLGALQDQNISKLIAQTEQLRQQGYPAAGIAKQLSTKLRELLTDTTTPFPTVFVTSLLKALIDVPASHDPETLFEVILIESITALPAAGNPDIETSPAAAGHPALRKQPKQQPADPPPKKQTAESAPEPKPQEKPEAGKHKAARALDGDIWSQALTALKQTHNTLYSVVRMAEPAYNGNTVVLNFKFAFHQKRVNEAKNKQVITDILASIMGKPVRIDCTLDSSTQPAPETAGSTKKKTAETPPADNLSTISNIFGNAEMVE